MTKGSCILTICRFPLIIVSTENVEAGFASLLLSHLEGLLLLYAPDAQIS